jgi:hypothetical protein
VPILFILLYVLCAVAVLVLVVLPSRGMDMLADLWNERTHPDAAPELRSLESVYFRSFITCSILATVYIVLGFNYSKLTGLAVLGIIVGFFGIGQLTSALQNKDEADTYERECPRCRSSLGLSDIPAKYELPFECPKCRNLIVLAADGKRGILQSSMPKFKSGPSPALRIKGSTVPNFAPYSSRTALAGLAEWNDLSGLHEELARLEQVKLVSSLPGHSIYSYAGLCQHHNASQVLLNFKSALATILRSAEQKPTTEVWTELISPSIKNKFEAMSNSLPATTRHWTFQSWLNWFVDEDRGWSFWSAEVVHDGRIRVNFLVLEATFPSFPLELLMRSCGVSWCFGEWKRD